MLVSVCGLYFLVFLILVPLGSLVGQTELAPKLGDFAPYIGKTWKAEIGRSADHAPMYDIARWERALNGKAIRVLHSVDNGAYGGETIIVWDARKESIVFYYFTTAGFYTQGISTVTSDGILNVEEVVGNENGITRVESTSMITAEGTMLVESRMLKDGVWQEPERVVYQEDASASVIFR